MSSEVDPTNSGELLKFGNQNFRMVKIFNFMKIDKKNVKIYIFFVIVIRKKKIILLCY